MRPSVLQVCFLMLPLLSLATAVCPNGYTDASGFCYKFNISVTLSWADAKASCEVDGGHIVVEVSAQEHSAFVNYRNSLPVQGDPMWTGLYVKNGTQWAFLSDAGFSSINSSTVYMHWKGGITPPTTPGQCGATTQNGTDQVWDSMSCSLPLNFVCEKASSIPSSSGTTTTTSSPVVITNSPPTSTNSPITTSLSKFRSWRKEFPDYKFTTSTYVVANMAMTHAPSLTSCAILCTSAAECVAFNHRPMDDKCEYILTEVNETSQLTSMAGWDVWIET